MGINKFTQRASLMVQAVGAARGTPGRLRAHLREWKRIAAPKQVRDWIKNGVRLPLTGAVPRHVEHNHVPAEAESFMDEEVARLSSTGAIEATSREKAVCILPLGAVPKKAGSSAAWRAIYDGRYVNGHMDVPSFKYEDLGVVQEMVEAKDWMEHADLADGFHHLSICAEHRKYVCFEWRGVVYRWVALAFGLACSPYYFGKTVRPCVLHMRKMGLRLSSYVDDFLWLNAVEAECAVDSKRFRAVMEAMGWSINEKKSSKAPAQVVQHLGLIIDTTGDVPMFKVPYEKLKRIRQLAKRVLKEGRAGRLVLRELARFAGLCLSVARAVLPARLLLRSIYGVVRDTRADCTSGKAGWTRRVKMSAEALDEAEWWCEALATWNGRSVRPRAHTAVLTTDASESGFGATLEMDDNSTRMAGMWTEAEAARSSNWRELSTVRLALSHWGARLTGRSVLVRSDNTTAIAYVNRFGGRYKDLLSVATSLLTAAWALDMELKAVHIPGVLNVISDELSRLKDKSDWVLRRRAFRRLEEQFGAHTVDRFATRANRRLPRFNSRLPEPDSEAQDAMVQDWAKENNYCCPPFAMISRVLRLIETQRASTTLVAPVWLHATWWPHLARLCNGVVTLSQSDFKAGRSGKVEPWSNGAWSMAAFRISFV